MQASVGNNYEKKLILHNLSQFAIIPDGGEQIFLDHLAEHTGGKEAIKFYSGRSCRSHLQLGIIIH